MLSLARNPRQSLIAFARHEALDTQRRVPAGFVREAGNDRRVDTVGVSWKPIPNVVMKLDWQDFEDRGGTGVDQVNLALGFIF